MRKIVCYGDSNTYGYDPADMQEGRYPADIRWTDRMAERLKGKWEVIAQGLNGRCLPERRYDFQRIRDFSGFLGQEDIFAVMLGTNDLLQAGQPDAAIPVARMEELLRFLTGFLSPGQILLLAPVRVGASATSDPYYKRCREESGRMNAGFCHLAEKYGTLFADTAEWDIPLAFDQVHFSIEGCRRFADRMVELLTSPPVSDRS